MKNELKPVHVIHLLLYTPTSTDNSPVPIFGRTRLMKMVFLFEKEFAKEFYKNTDNLTPFDFGFESYNYGPFSKDVYEAINFLESRDIIEIQNKPLGYVDPNDIELDRMLSKSDEQNILFQTDNFNYVEEFNLSVTGIKIMKNKDNWFSWAQLNDNQKELLINFKTKMIRTPLRNILRYVYSKYPKYIDKSFIVHNLFPEGI